MLFLKFGVKILGMFNLPFILTECRIVPSYMHGLSGLSGNLFSVLANDFKLGYISFRVV